MGKVGYLNLIIVSVILFLINFGLNVYTNHYVKYTWVGDTIYIKADGRVHPPDAPIMTRDYRIYTITNNIKVGFGDGIIIERDNIVLIGNGYTLEGTEFNNGVVISGRVNVTIKNLEIKGFYYGIEVKSSTGIRILNNKLTENKFGIYLDFSNNNMVAFNVITNNEFNGIYLYYSNNNLIVNNTVTYSRQDGVDLYYSNSNDVKNNVIMHNEYGIILRDSNNNKIVNNTVTHNYYGIYLSYSEYNVVIDNKLMNSYYYGVTLYDGSDNNEVRSNEIVNSGKYGIYIASSKNNKVLSNVIKNNRVGLYLRETKDNVILYNGFFNNDVQVTLDYTVGTNKWDDGIRGNYWSNHNCIDNNKDGVCENHYIIRDPDNVDKHPLSSYQQMLPTTPTHATTPKPTSTDLSPRDTFSPTPKQTSDSTVIRVLTIAIPIIVLAVAILVVVTMVILKATKK